MPPDPPSVLTPPALDTIFAALLSTASAGLAITTE